jgi:hypothetical protein
MLLAFLVLTARRHRVAVGFHAIKKSEGRNDVFSPVYTRWEKGPSSITYDFACQLHSYCAARENWFFEETLFNIDDAHGKGHKCLIYKLKLYKLHGAQLLKFLAATVAETGNSPLRNIKRSASYMKQSHLMMYVRLMLEVQNRMRIQKLNKQIRQ